MKHIFTYLKMLLLVAVMSMQIAPASAQLQNCPGNAVFTYFPLGPCCYRFASTDPTPAQSCDAWYVNGNPVAMGADGMDYCFPGPGPFQVCFETCCQQTDGTISTVQTCQIVGVSCGPPFCSPNADFFAADQGNCCWLFTDNTPDSPTAALPMCDLWEILDAGNNVIATSQGDSYLFCFPAAGVYTICNHDCCLDANGVLTNHDYCSTITVAGCGQPCDPDPTFTVTDIGNCCFLFHDNTVDNPIPGVVNCDMWEVFDANGTSVGVQYGDNFTFCFSASGTYNVCNTDCCVNSDGSLTYETYCQFVTANCPTPCVPDPVFTIVDLGNCCYVFQDNTFENPIPGITGCDYWEIIDPLGNVITTFNGNNVSYCFTASGTYTICNTDCCQNSDGTIITLTSCQTITVNCSTPCMPDAAYLITDLGGCCFQFDDLTPNTPPLGCEHWTVYDPIIGTVLAQSNGNSFTWCAPASGNYMICYEDCCIGADGTVIYKTNCQTITANCGCCIPYTFNYNVTGCEVCVTPLANCPLPSPNTYITYDYGDGSGVTTNTCHGYAVSGTYNVCMTSCCINSDGTLGNCVTHCKQVTVNCGEPCAPEVYFDFINWGMDPCCVDVVAVNPVLCVDPNDPTSVTVDVNGDGNIDIQDWQIILNNNCCSFSFGDGSPLVYGPGPHHHCYTTPGYYLICYTACCIGTDGVVYSETLCKDAYFDCQPCDVDPYFLVTQGINPCCYIFDDVTPDNGLLGATGCNYWEIFDSNNILVSSSFGDTYSFCFTANGTYTVCNTDCCVNPDGTISSETYCQTIEVNCFCTPDASFDLVDLGNCCYQVTGINCPTIVTGIPPFQNDGPCCSVDWGDGSPVVYGNGPHTHCYTGNGNYTICYTTCCVQSDGTISYATHCETVFVMCCCDPIGFDYTIENCTVCVVPIYPAGCIAPNTNIWVEWGGPGTAVGNLCFTYDQSGTYDICLYSCCPSQTYPCDPVPICQQVTVDCCCLPTDFNTASNGCTLTFTPLYNCNGMNNIFWDFGDGTSGTGNIPSHTYDGSGTYHICMTACCCPYMNADGTVSNGNCITICHDITVDCGCIDPSQIDPNIGCLNVYEPVCGCDGVTYPNACVAYYQYGVTSYTPGPCAITDCCLLPDGIITSVAGCCVNFGLFELGCCFAPNVATHFWTFGDGNTSTAYYPLHCYGAPGTYNVTVTSTCTDGSSNVLTTTVTVNCPVIDPCDDVNVGFVYETAGLLVNYFETGDIPVEDQFVSRTWSFGDGTISSDENPVHLYDVSGTYEVSLNIEITDSTTGADCVDTFTWSVTVESYCPGDLDNNGVINVADILQIMAAYGGTCP